MTMDLFDDELTQPPAAEGELAGDDVTDDPLVNGLNPEQRRAVLHKTGPLLVLAGAGSGKTRVITQRIAWLIERRRVAPWRILAVTFSNKAAGEMRHRLDALLGGAAGDLWLGTFHAIGVRLLRQLGEHAGIGRSFTIYDRDDQQRMLVRVLRALGLSEKVHTPRKLGTWIDNAKNRCLSPGDPDLPDDETADHVAGRVYAAYEAEMRRATAVDFGDLLMLPVRILRDNPVLREHWSARFEHVLVDEFQDTNGAQYALLELLSGHYGNLAVVGDDDQSIYSWRGAEVRNILDFPQTHPGAVVVRLEQNYRSSEVILKTSGAVVKHNRDRHDKTLWTDRKGGDKVELHESASDRDEADWVARKIERAVQEGVPLGEVAIFYRTNAQSRVLEESMARFRLPYIVVGGLRFYERAEIKDLLAYCRLMVNADDTASFLRVVNTPTRGIGGRTIELIEAHARAMALPPPRAAADLVRRGEGGRSREKLAAFIALVDTMRAAIAGTRADVAGGILLKQSGLRDALLAESSDEAKQRLENLGELVSAMAEHAESADDPTLEGFLETVALVSDLDAVKAGGRYASLMTMHAAKGLEFDVTFVTGLEESLLPHGNSNGDDDEERRLLYVAMTRARKRMHLSWARIRMKFGREELGLPSPFLNHLPPDQLNQTSDPGTSAFRIGGFPASGQGRRGFSWTGGRAPSGLGSRDAIAKVSKRDDGISIVHTEIAERSDEPVFQREIEGPFRVGGRAFHSQFGGGEVLDVSGYGPTARITVKFARAGVKKVLARFLTAR